ncbi:MAG TPA: DUF2207 domain-containing protein [Rhodanobacteraceae bacterium]|nr:DUF2207 domain-containing protein [Rhodanobacteraceae bacterium]
MSHPVRSVWYGLVLLAFGVIALATPPCRAEERILDYHADISIAADAGLTVTEHIRVQAEGDRIRHGIYRDFPTRYRDPYKNAYRVDFDVTGATRDGEREDWHTEAKSNGVRIYLGSADTLVDAGDHEYTLSYRTRRQMGYFADHDELYWNVTGNGWIFPIDQASATVRLPGAVPASALKAFGFTGPQGSQEHALTTKVEAGGADYRTTRGLGAEEGLSVVLEFPKGTVAEPDRWQRLRWLLRDNLKLTVGLIGLLLLWLYYGWAWNRYGRDPAAGVLMPLYEPPQGDSPAALRYVRDMGYDKTCFSAAVLGLAAKGHLDIRQDAADVITLTRKDGGTATLTADEKAFEAALFEGVDSLRLTQSSSVRARMQAADKALAKALSNGYEKKYFLTHGKTLLPGLAISLVSLVPIFVGAGDQVGAAVFISVWLTGWSFGTYMLVSAAMQTTRQARGVLAKAGSVFTWLFALPFIGGELAGLVFFGFVTGFAYIPVFLALIGTNVLFAHLMKAPTRDGARLLDGINGFRWYLGVAEKQELDSRYRPESRPDLFSAWLPYALALGVEQAWAERFTNALSAAQLEAARPSWYSGGSSLASGGLAGFTSSMSSSLSSAISSASTSPGSGSGGGGGGGSGGGGGGGGGGGW